MAHRCSGLGVQLTCSDLAEQRSGGHQFYERSPVRIPDEHQFPPNMAWLRTPKIQVSVVFTTDWNARSYSQDVRLGSGLILVVEPDGAVCAKVIGISCFSRMTAF